MNNFNNNFYGNQAPYGYPYQQNGYAFNQAPKLPNPTNPLTEEEKQILKQKNPQFSLAVSQIDNLQAICTHRDPKTGNQLHKNPDGTVTCDTCHNTFRFVENPNPESIEMIFRQACDCLETIKAMYVDIPDDVARTYFQMIPFLKKAPQLFKIALEHYNRYANPSLVGMDQYGGNNAVAMYGALFGSPMAMNPGMMNPGMMMNQPMPGATMGYNPAMGYPQQAPVADVTMGDNNNVNPFDVSAQQPNKIVTDNKQYSL